MDFKIKVLTVGKKLKLTIWDTGEFSTMHNIIDIGVQVMRFTLVVWQTHTHVTVKNLLKLSFFVSW